MVSCSTSSPGFINLYQGPNTVPDGIRDAPLSICALLSEVSGCL